MNNLFKPNFNKIENSEPIENTDIKQLLEDTKNNTEIDLSFFEKSNSDFIDQQKMDANIIKDNPKLESKVSNIQKGYQSARQELKKTFLTRLKNITKYTTGSIAALAFTVHFAQKEVPDYLSKEKETQEIEWNESTQQKIEKLGQEYAFLMKAGSFYKDVPTSFFENRFTDFVAKFGPDIEIVYTEDNTDIKNKIVQWAFKNVASQKDHRAHYFANTLFFENVEINLEKSIEIEDADDIEYIFEKSNLHDFSSEFAHHIGNDFSIGRSFTYAENLVSNKFKQNKMYTDAYSPEYQAHNITQDAIKRFLMPEDHNLNIDFVDIYNIEQEYYREIIKNKDYVKNKFDINRLINRLLRYKSLDTITKNKTAIFQNLEKIRKILDRTNTEQKLNSNMFLEMVDKFPLENLDNNYEIGLEDSLSN